mmetsp:Transcript_34942/g.77699  ORF Transcript_34942/g.77699 Transcript_34942/m.77699 type:complete len:431 (+) Transcript_34942:72-1364(+)|eukprot:CAMPEP_0202892594 /NCGR_PEP_ID=MMETSP1392-20130828/2301_1 /ASSEMBLY_ACC=CAM_ASM_000868 /TAXON_ID=225041 /ORGANISM="Chlamydomonas chlamydogama, Strain SAG 11-48b" /LENGTH=430 /DNA_ID=CAMNT_0049576607 /DNA_START=67 /DNA_END=1359 /DNA_ORIENTATION=-
MEIQDRWRDLDLLLTRSGNLVGPGFEPGPELRAFIQSEDCRVLCVGAGGLGCEILKDLALTGFVHIDVIDMDTIDVSNLNRQFLFRMHDVGKSKAEVAAERINNRVPGVKVTAHHGRIEEKPASFYQQFTVIILGLDSLEARRYMNSVVCSFLEFEEDGSPNLSTVKPMVDGGTEGFKGHARVLIPGVTPCFECTLWLFPPQTKFPLCTLAETPRSAAHCIEYAHLILWSQVRQGEEFDADNEEHMKWVYEKALERARQYGIHGVTYQLSQGVVKNIIPAIASTNAIVSAACVLEALKIITMCSSGLNNYLMYMGSQGIYTHTVAYERDTSCPICSAGVPLDVDPDATLQQVIDQMMGDPTLGKHLHAPSVSFGATNLYARGIFEAETRANLTAKISSLVPDDKSILTVNDKKLHAPMRLMLRYSNNMRS